MPQVPPPCKPSTVTFARQSCHHSPSIPTHAAGTPQRTLGERLAPLGVRRPRRRFSALGSRPDVSVEALFLTPPPRAGGPGAPQKRPRAAATAFSTTSALQVFRCAKTRPAPPAPKSRSKPPARGCPTADPSPNRPPYDCRFVQPRNGAHPSNWAKRKNLHFACHLLRALPQYEDDNATLSADAVV
jgi:hypothetical protein